MGRHVTSLATVVVASLAMALTACGQQEEVQRVEYAHDVGKFRANLNVSQASGCSTTVVQGLTDQLIEELNCISPNLMVDFSGPRVNLYSAVNPYLAPSAASAITAAAQSQNDVISVSSAYRSLAQQYLLYKWWKAGQCGIQIAAVPGNSNHQSGRAVDVPYYSYWNSSLTSHGWTWYGSGDVVHFDFLSATNVASKSILAFQKLWNKNHSTNQLTEDSTWGPATESAMASSPAAGFAIHGCVTTGSLVGYIYENGNTANRVPGATVKVGSDTVTTGTDGKYTFTLAPGAYNVFVSKSGYTSNQVSRTVTAGSTVWGSMEINAVATTGTLRGTVFALEANGTKGAAIAGASVSAGGQSAMTDAGGAFALTLPAGTYTLTVGKSGFEPASSSQTVTAGTDTVADVGMQPAMVDAPPVITIDDPASGAAWDVARVTLKGSATDDTGAVAVKIAVGSNAATDSAVENGIWSAEVKLHPGENTVTATATDAAGHSTSVTWTGTFRSGLSGVVHRYDEPAATLANAAVTLTDATTGAQVASATTDATGHFELDVAQVPGSFALSVSADGFVADTRTLELTDEARATVDVGMTPGEEGVYSVRFIEPKPGAVIDAAETNVSGVIEGLQLASVKVNGVDALLLGQSAFLAKVPLAEGHNVLEVVAQSSEGHEVTATIEVDRPVSEITGKTGCAAMPTEPFFAVGLLTLSAGLRRRKPRR